MVHWEIHCIFLFSLALIKRYAVGFLLFLVRSLSLSLALAVFVVTVAVVVVIVVAAVVVVVFVLACACNQATYMHTLESSTLH